jgi:hypothetical protein
MSSLKVLLAIVAGYVGLALWWAAREESLDGFARRLARLGRRPRRLERYRYLSAALVVVVAAVVAAVVGTHDVGSRGKAAPRAAVTQRVSDRPPLQLRRVLQPPVTVAAHAHARRNPQAHLQHVSNLVEVSAHVTPPAPAPAAGPAPLPAPAPSPAPSPLAAP